jgi:predicted nucleic acid-binding protein
MIIVLDAGPLGFACSPRREPSFGLWLEAAHREGHQVVVSQATDYEVRRELLRTGLDLSLARLDRLVARFRFVPVSGDIWLSAARLWAESRNRGQPTADRNALDIDVLLAATAMQLQDEDDVVVATTNVRHLSQFVDARLWNDITFPAADSPPPPGA